MTSNLQINNRLVLFLLLSALALLNACSDSQDHPWTKAVPEAASMLYVFGEDDQVETLTDALDPAFIQFMDNIESSSVASVTEIENVTGNQLLPLAVFSMPVNSNELTHVWITRLESESIAGVVEPFSRDFSENSYNFNDRKIYRLFLQESPMHYATQLGSWVLISSSSSALESGIRSYSGLDTAMRFDPEALRDQPEPTPKPGVHLNFEGLSKQLKQLGKVVFRPFLDNSFKGLKSAHVNQDAEDERMLELNLKLQPSSDGSALVSALSAPPRRFDMPRYIPTDAAVFGMFSVPESRINPDSYRQETGLDSLLVQSANRIMAFSSTLGREAGFAGFHTLGFDPLNESVFVREVSDKSTLRAELERLVNTGNGTKLGDVYTFRSRVLARTLGGPFCVYQNFSVGIVNDLLVLAPRSGLIQRVENDISRRRVMYYDDDFLSFMEDLPESQSAFLYIDNADFPSFIEPYTDPVSPAMAYLPYFDLLTMSAVVDESGEVEMNTRLYNLERSEEALTERWYYPYSNAGLVAAPSVGRLSGGFRNDVVFATDANQVTALAADGTRIFQASTGRDRPLGSPILVDWYANNQTAVLIAAGNKVYGWNNRGQMLPNFPFELDERITAPIFTADISRSGSPEVIVATADRQLHVLGGRGRNISGWPQTTNGVVREQPVYKLNNRRYSIWATAENAIFSWDSNGNLREDFPVFTDAPLNGPLQFLDDNIFASGSNGNLYAISGDGFFDEEFIIQDTPETNGASDESSLVVEAIDVADSPVSISDIRRMPVREIIEEEENMDSDSDQEPRMENIRTIILQSEGGSVFLYSLDGRLRFTRSTGRAMARNHPMIIEDLNGDNKQELLVVTNVGRMYAWTVEDEERFTELPTASVQFPVVSQLGSDGLTNIIAGTSNGIRVWAFTD